MRELNFYHYHQFYDKENQFYDKYPQFTKNRNIATVEVLSQIDINVDEIYKDKPIWKHFIDFFLLGGNFNIDKLTSYKHKFVDLSEEYVKMLNLEDSLIDKFILNPNLIDQILNYLLEVDKWKDIELMLYSTSTLLVFMFDHVEGLYEKYRYIVDNYEKDDSLIYQLDYEVNELKNWS